MKNIEDLRNEIQQFKISNAEELEQFRVNFLSKKSEIQAMLANIKNVVAEQRKTFGQQVNELKQMAQQMFEDNKQKLELVF